jgi:hypothetical protein
MLHLVKQLLHTHTSKGLDLMRILNSELVTFHMFICHSDELLMDSGTIFLYLTESCKMRIINNNRNVDYKIIIIYIALLYIKHTLSLSSKKRIWSVL